MKIILTGQAGSGKDTVGGMIAKKRNGVCIAQADPMKRFAARVFGFGEETLWGSSEKRNQPVSEIVTEYSVNEWWDISRLRLEAGAQSIVEEVLGDLVPDDAASAIAALDMWFNEIENTHGSAITPRIILQTLGTEWGRDIDPGMWNRWANRTADQLVLGGKSYTRMWGLFEDPTPPQPPSIVVITDGRFRNEVMGTRNAGGYAIQVLEAGKREAGNVGVAGHRSEVEQRGIPRWWFNLVIHNDKSKGLEDLDLRVDAALEYLFPEPQVHSVFDATEEESEGKPN